MAMLYIFENAIKSHENIYVLKEEFQQVIQLELIDKYQSICFCCY
jgi:hypothetical protein